MNIKTIIKENVTLDELAKEIIVLTHELARERQSVPLLTITQEAVLRLLKENGSLTLKELKGLLNLDTYQISRLLSSIESFRGGNTETSLIKREPHKVDKRQWVISLSGDGQKVLEEEVRRRMIRIKTMTEPLTEDEKNAFISIIKKMTHSLKHKHSRTV